MKAHFCPNGHVWQGRTVHCPICHARAPQVEVSVGRRDPVTGVKPGLIKFKLEKED